MNEKETLRKVENYVKDLLEKEGTGHDWYHIQRVVKTAEFIQAKEGGGLFVIRLAALLHDIADWKFNDDVKAGGKKAKELLEKLHVESSVINQVVYIIDHLSFKGGTNTHTLQSVEGKIVQDADRLDALGAIGIGRTFAYGGHKSRPMYDPEIKPRQYESIEDYKKAENHTINHFYEKLLLLKDQMNTTTGKRLAKQRHDFMETFLNEFYKEWNVELK